MLRVGVCAHVPVCSGAHVPVCIVTCAPTRLAQLLQSGTPPHPVLGVSMGMARCLSSFSPLRVLIAVGVSPGPVMEAGGLRVSCVTFCWGRYRSQRCASEGALHLSPFLCVPLRRPLGSIPQAAPTAVQTFMQERSPCLELGSLNLGQRSTITSFLYPFSDRKFLFQKRRNATLSTFFLLLHNLLGKPLKSKQPRADAEAGVPQPSRRGGPVGGLALSQGWTRTLDPGLHTVLCSPLSL